MRSVNLRSACTLAVLMAALQILIFSALPAWAQAPVEERALRQIYKNTRGLESFSLDEFRGSETMWLLCLGQSNAANSGDEGRGFQPNVYSYYDGKVYAAKDPLLGATGRGSSVWTALGREIIKRKMAQKVVLVPFAVGGTSIDRWQPNDPVGSLLGRTLASLKANKIEVSFILWQQGESDSDMGSEKYSDMLLQLKTGFVVSGQHAPMIVAFASRKRRGISTAVRQGQHIAADKSPCIIFEGPDADALGRDLRRDGIHFSTAGQDRLAVMWADNIQSARDALATTCRH